MPELALERCIDSGDRRARHRTDQHDHAQRPRDCRSDARQITVDPRKARDQDLIDRINHALIQDTQNRSSLARRAEVLHRVESLTPRERQVMDLVVEGAANKVIAIDLGLSERTVEVHRAKVMEKMGSRSVAHLVKLQLTLAQEI